MIETRLVFAAIAGGTLALPVVAQPGQAPQPDEPIVSDSQFEEALPPLDPSSGTSCPPGTTADCRGQSAPVHFDKLNGSSG